jgi:Holliday junction resolvase RusA-like endonuclease
VKLSFVVQGPPVPKPRARVMAGYSFTPPRAREWEKLVALRALEARPSGWPLDADYRVRVAVYRQARRGDLDNFVKAATDAMNRTVYEDDRQIVELHALLFDDKSDPRLLVEVEAA